MMECGGACIHVGPGEFLMSRVRNFILGVEWVDLRRSLTIVMSAVDVLVSGG